MKTPYISDFFASQKEKRKKKLKRGKIKMIDNYCRS